MTTLWLFVSQRFQVLFHSPPGVLFTLPSRYSCAIGRQRVLSLTRWSSQIRTGFPGSRTTWEHRREVIQGSCTGPLPSVARLSRALPLLDDLITPWRFCRPSWWVPQPRRSIAGRLYHYDGLGYSRFARRYSGSRCCFSFLGVLRCFNSPGALHRPYVFGPG